MRIWSDDYVTNIQLIKTFVTALEAEMLPHNLKVAIRGYITIGKHAWFYLKERLL